MENFDEQLKQLNKEWCEAGYRESVIREFAFLPITQLIGGIEVKQLTPLAYMYLDFINSPFVNPKERISLDDVFQFLWVLNKDFKIGDKDGYEKFIAKNAALDLVQTIQDGFDYMDEAFLDSPPVEKKETPKTNHRPTVAWITNYIDLLAVEFGWSDTEILNLPIARMFQYVKSIEARRAAQNGMRAVQFNKLSDKAKSKLHEHLKVMAEQKGKKVVVPESEEQAI